MHHDIKSDRDERTHLARPRGFGDAIVKCDVSMDDENSDVVLTCNECCEEPAPVPFSALGKVANEATNAQFKMASSSNSPLVERVCCKRKSAAIKNTRITANDETVSCNDMSALDADKTSHEVNELLHDKKSSLHTMKAISGRNNLNSLATVPLGKIGKKNAERRARSFFYVYRDEVNGQLDSVENHHRVAAVLAYGIFRQWMHRRRHSINPPNGMIEESSESVFYYTALLLVQTMVFAIRSDGRIEDSEYSSLVDFCSSVFNNQIKNIRGEIDRMLTIDLDPEFLAKMVKYPEESLDMYLLSSVIVNRTNHLELNYLENLAACLGIEPSLKKNLDHRADSLIDTDAKDIMLRDSVAG